MYTKMKYILSFSLVLLFSLGMSNSTFAQAAESLEVKVKGVGCSKDVANIKGNLEKLSGVSSCEVVKKGPTTTFAVSYNPEKIAVKKIYQIIEDTGDCLDPNDKPHRVQLK